MNKFMAKKMILIMMRMNRKQDI